MRSTYKDWFDELFFSSFFSLVLVDGCLMMMDFEIEMMMMNEN